MTAHTVKQCRAWHETTSLGLHARSNDVGRGMSSPPLDNTHGRTTSNETCHHHLWKAHTVQRRRVWLDITLLGLHARLDDVGRGMILLRLDSTHDRLTFGVACHHRPWTAHTVGRRRAWHDITVLGQHTLSDGVGQGMTSSPLGRTRSDYVGRGMTSSPLGSTHGRTTSGVA